MRFLFLLLFSCCWFSTLEAYPSGAPEGVLGSGKAAYRNYFLGNHYYQEEQPEKALGYFRRAYTAARHRSAFALAYALVLAETERAEEGIRVLNSFRGHLLPLHPEYAQQLTHFYHVSAIVRARAGQYAVAASSLKRAIRRTQTYPLQEVRHRLAGMYSLQAYLSIMNQETPRAHQGLAAHVHLQKRELDTAFDLYKRSLSLDTSRQDAQLNLALLADTLERSIDIEPVPSPLPDYKKAGVYDKADFPHLPRGVEQLLPFGHFDELIYLVDISGSMVMENLACLAADRFTVMKEAADYLLTFLPDSTRAGLATIGGDCQDEPDWWIPTDSLSRRQLKFQLRHLNPNGTTPLLTTLLRAPELFSDDPNTTKSIFFISDGENVCALPGVDICDWAETLAERNITLNVLTFLDKGLNNSGAFAEYACLADRSGGRVRYLDPLSCSIDEAEFDLVDQVQFTLPPFQRVQCWGQAAEYLWAIFPE